MLGAIAGDIIGSVYEGRRHTNQEDFPLFDQFCHFTDDTVLTVAVAEVVMDRTGPIPARAAKEAYAAKLRLWGRRYPHAGYGGMFRRWLAEENSGPYNSCGNGSAMRVSSIGFAFDTLEEVLREAAWSAAVTHNHPEGVKGAQAAAAATFLARKSEDKAAIRSYINKQFGYDLNRSVADIRATYHFDVTCQGTVPEAVIAFLDSSDYEDAVRKAVSLGGDADTLACITGGIAQAYYKQIPKHIADRVYLLLDSRIRSMVARFEERYGPYR